jgi:Glycoside Hydrolase Family 113
MPERPASLWRARLQTWLACAALYYPFFWISTSVNWTAPALARTLFSGERLTGFSLTAFGASAASAPPLGSSGLAQGGEGRAAFSLAAVMLVVIAATVILTWVGRRARVFSGLAIAVLADVALANGARRLFGFHRTSPGLILASLVFFSALCFGLRWMLSGVSEAAAWQAGPAGAGRVRGFFTRFGNLLGGFVLLPLLPWVWFSWWRGFELGRFALALMAPAALAALVSSLGAFKHPVEPRQIGWRGAIWGVAAVALLAVGVRAGQGKISRARAASMRAAMAAYPQVPADAPYRKHFFQKGVSVSAEGWGGYESESGREILKALRRDGVNAVALVPYGFEPRGRPEVRLNTGAGSWESDEGIEEMSRVAHALGMKVMLKPGIWVGDGGYSGELEFASAADRAKWFESYGEFLAHYARLATRIHADLFCVGGEFVKLTPYESDWRKLIARARRLYPGPLVYAANFGGEFESVKFWDALDDIGLQEYYPLPDDLATSEIVRKVEAVEQKYQRPVIFTEVGFASGQESNRTPWEDGHGAPDPQLQAKCYQAIFRAFYRKPWFEGMYWWKVGTNGFGGPEDTSLSPWSKPAMQVVKQWYTQTER